MSERQIQDKLIQGKCETEIEERSVPETQRKVLLP